MTKKWNEVTFTSRQITIPRICPNCMSNADKPVKNTTICGNKMCSQTFYYCDRCVGAAKIANNFRWAFLASLFIPIPFPPFGIIFYFWYKGKQKRLYPQRSEQAVWGHAAKITYVGSWHDMSAYKAARPEWLEKLKELNKSSLPKKESQAGIVCDMNPSR